MLEQREGTWRKLYHTINYTWAAVPLGCMVAIIAGALGARELVGTALTYTCIYAGGLTVYGLIASVIKTDRECAESIRESQSQAHEFHIKQLESEIERLDMQIDGLINEATTFVSVPANVEVRGAAHERKWVTIRRLGCPDEVVDWDTGESRPSPDNIVIK